MKHIAIIPARSGSKEILNKNILSLLDKPLIAYTIDAALKSGIYDDVIVSTNSEKYAEIARSHGAHVPFLRSDDLSQDSTILKDVTFHVLKQLKDMGKQYKTVSVLQPTCPLRDYIDIQNAYTFFCSKKAEAIISIYKTKNPYYYGGTLPPSKSLKYFIPPKYRQKQRQDMEKFYMISGAIFMANVQLYTKNNDPFTLSSFGFCINQHHALDIDSVEDLLYAQLLLQNKTL